MQELVLAYLHSGFVNLVFVLVKGRHLNDRDLLLYQRSGRRRRGHV